MVDFCLESKSFFIRLILGSVQKRYLIMLSGQITPSGDINTWGNPFIVWWIAFRKSRQFVRILQNDIRKKKQINISSKRQVWLCDLFSEHCRNYKFSICVFPKLNVAILMRFELLKIRAASFPFWSIRVILFFGRVSPAEYLNYSKAPRYIRGYVRMHC